MQGDGWRGASDWQEDQPQNVEVDRSPDARKDGIQNRDQIKHVDREPWNW